MTLLVLFYSSAAFDTDDHGILLRRLLSLLVLRGTALFWFHSYLEGRAQRSSVNGTLSNRFALQCGFQQGSCLGPLLFPIYASKLFEILLSYLSSAHAYDDDCTQLHMPSRPSDSLNKLEAVNGL